MYTFLDYSQQGGEYSAQVDTHQSELRREEKICIKTHCLYTIWKLIIWIWKIQRKLDKEQIFHTQNAVIVEDLTQQNNASKNSGNKRVRNSMYVTNRETQCTLKPET